MRGDRVAEGAHDFVGDFELEAEFALPFLTHNTGTGRERLLSFARAHPWLVSVAASEEDTRTCKPIVLASRDPDEAAARILDRVWSYVPDDFPDILARLRNFGQPELLVGPQIQEDVFQACRIPLRFWPPQVPQGTPLDAPAQQAMMSFVASAAFLVRIAEYARIDVADLLGRFDGWAGYLEKLRTRGGNQAADPASTMGGWCLASDIVQSVSDMICAFEAEVVRPAVHRIDPGCHLLHRPVEKNVSMQINDMDLFGAAVRLLLRDGTFPKLVETAREWHARSPAIARVLAERAGDRMRAGPKLFERIDLADGTHLVCLNRPHELLAEGLDGPDPDGRPGLAHCVGSYVERVARGQTFVLGVRAPDPAMGWRRVATVEIDRVPDDGGLPEIAQHKALRNGDPSVENRKALVSALPAIAAAMRERQGEPITEDEFVGWTQILAEDGAWESVRDAWAFAIQRDRRSLGHEEFLEGALDELVASHLGASAR